MRKSSVSLSVNSKKIKECFQNFNNFPPKVSFCCFIDEEEKRNQETH